MQFFESRFGLRTLEAYRKLPLLLELCSSLGHNDSGTSLGLGGVLSIYNTSEQYMEQTWVGVVSGGKSEKYSKLSQEKALRTAEQHKQRHNFLFASNSANPDENQFAGAVIFDDRFVFSFSGLTAYADEVFATMFGLWYAKKNLDEFWSTHAPACALGDLPYTVKELFPRFQKEVLNLV